MLTLYQDTKLPPRAAFAAQIIGTLFGSILNFSEYLMGACERNHY